MYAVSTSVRSCGLRRVFSLDLNDLEDGRNHAAVNTCVGPFFSGSYWASWQLKTCQAGQVPAFVTSGVLPLVLSKPEPAATLLQRSEKGAKGRDVVAHLLAPALPEAK